MLVMQCLRRRGRTGASKDRPISYVVDASAHCAKSKQSVKSRQEQDGNEC